MSETQTLDGLVNPKHRKKEFKSKAKELRSKDNNLRQFALNAVFSDTRYLIEGECIVPFLETLTPNKVYNCTTRYFCGLNSIWNQYDVLFITESSGLYKRLSPTPFTIS